MPSTRNANYGATHSSGPPPPYAAPVPPALRTDWLPDDSSRTPLCERPLPPHTKTTRLSALAIVVVVTCILTAGLCAHMLPLTYCNDPADPRVRDRIRGEWHKEVVEHQRHVAEREVVQARWAWEDEQHTALLREWEAERVRHEQELVERARREEEARVRLGLSWSRVEAHQCTRYGTREYTAVLTNLPMNWAWRVDACKATPLEIHGVLRTPTSCEDRGHGVVIGRWEVDQYEPDCNSSWIWYKDKGCTSPGSGRRRIEFYLENLPKGADYRAFCATTPVHFHGMDFIGAQECKAVNTGAWGWWVIDDMNC